MHQSVRTMPMASPCHGFPASIEFQDVAPDELARETLHEHRRTPAAGAWQDYLSRVLPALERQEAGAMAEALHLAGLNREDARRHAMAMRRRSIAAGDLRRMTFWDEVANTLHQRG